MTLGTRTFRHPALEHSVFVMSSPIMGIIKWINILLVRALEWDRESECIAAHSVTKHTPDNNEMRKTRGYIVGAGNASARHNEHEARRNWKGF